MYPALESGRIPERIGPLCSSGSPDPEQSRLLGKDASVSDDLYLQRRDKSTSVGIRGTSLGKQGMLSAIWIVLFLPFCAKVQLLVVLLSARSEEVKELGLRGNSPRTTKTDEDVA